MHIKNCTNETLLIPISAGNHLTLPPAETPAIVTYAYKPYGERHIQFGASHQCYQMPIRLEVPIIENLPDPEFGIIYIVDPHVLAVVDKDRKDVFTYSDEKTDGHGNIILSFLIGTIASKLPQFLHSPDDLQRHLQTIIPIQSASRAEYTTFLKSAMSAVEYRELVRLVEVLKERGTIGYKIERDCVRVVLKLRKGETTPCK